VRSEVEGSYKSLNTAALAFHEYALDGINEKGVFIGEMTIGDPAYAGILSPDYPKRPSVFSHHMMRIVLDTCASVDEAVALFSHVPVWFTNDPWHFFLADAAGNFAVVEYDKSGQLAITRQTGGVLVSANTALMEGRESLMKDPRYAIADKYVGEHGADGIAAHASMAELMKYLALREDNPKYPSVIGIRATLWTSTYDLVERTMVIRYWEDGYKEHRLGF
jgi:choloylglycine hydrolase